MFGGLLGGDGGADRDVDHADGDGPDPETHTLAGEPYDITPTGDRIREGGVVTKVDTEDEGVVAGPRIRRLIERGYADDVEEPDLLLGYQEDMQEGFVAAGIPYDNQFRHIWRSGASGAGKSNSMETAALSRAYNGEGFALVDPKGEDSRELMRKLPEHRLDDVIWIEPGSTEHDHVVGLNPLDVPHTDAADGPALSRAIEGRLELLKATLSAKDELHATMEAVTESVGRAMMKANADPERPNYSLIDFYFVLLGAERREDFAEECQDPYVREFLHEIADMDDEQLRPLLKRVKAWVENGVVRRIIARRESSIDFDDVLENDRILIVRAAVNSTDVNRLTTLAIFRELWDAKNRQTDRADGDPPGYYLAADEFDEVICPELDIKGMFARARSKRLGLSVSVQYPSQLSRDERKPLTNNASNSAFMRTNDGEDAGILMDRFRGHDADDLIETRDYHLWTEIPHDDGSGDRSDPLKLKTFPPYPPLRSAAEAEDVIRESVARYGDEPLTDAEIQRELPYGDVAEATGDLEVTDDVKRAVAKAVHDHALRVDGEPGYVPLPDVTPDVRRYVARETGLSDERVEEVMGTPGQVYRQVLKYCRGWIDDRDGDDAATEVRATDDAVARILAVGEDESDGSAAHARLLRSTYVALTERGGEVEVLRQGDEQGSPPDARLHAGPHADPVVEALAGGPGETAEVEAEKSTGDTKPGQTVLNLAGAVDKDRRCLFVARPEQARTVSRTLAEPPRLASAHDDESDETRLFNSTRRVRVDGAGLAYREGSRESRWYRDADTGDLILRDDAGDEHARFTSPAGITRNAEAYAAVGDEEAADDRDLRTIRSPVVPERCFPDAFPGCEGEEWDLLTVENGDLGVFRSGDRDAAPLDVLADDADRADGRADHAGDGGDGVGGPDPDDLDVHDRAADLYRLLLEERGRGGTVTRRDAADLADEHADREDLDVDATSRTVRNWIRALVEQGALRVDERDDDADRLEIS